MCAYTYTHTPTVMHTKDDTYVHKLHSLATFSQPGGPKVSACFPSLSICISECILVFGLWGDDYVINSAACSCLSYKICSKPTLFRKILIYARQTVNTERLVWQTHRICNDVLAKTRRKQMDTLTYRFLWLWIHLWGCHLKWETRWKENKGRKGRGATMEWREIKVQTKTNEE